MHQTTHPSHRSRVQGDALAGVLIALMVAMVIAGVVVFFVVRGTVVTTTTQSNGPTATVSQPTPNVSTPVPSEVASTEAAESAPEAATEEVADAPTSEAGVQISGIIRDSSGDPVEGATITFGGTYLGALDNMGDLSDAPESVRKEIAAAAKDSGLKVAETQSATDGYYELFLPIPHPTSAPADDEAIQKPLDLEIRVSHRGYIEQTREISVLRGDQQRADFVLSPGAVITGRVVVTDTGAPAVGMKVNAAEGEDEGMPFLGALGVFGADNATVRDDGTFEIAGIAPGTYRVSVQSNNTRFMTPQTAHIKTVELTRDRLTAEVEFKVEVGGTLTGRVSNRAGQPIAGVEARILPADFMQSAMQSDFSSMFGITANEAETDENGEFQILGVPFGQKLRVMVDSDDHARPEPVAFQLAKDQPEHHVEIQLEVGSSISGLVVDENGEPVADVEVQVIPDIGKMLSGGLDPSGFDIEAETDDAGRFTIEHLRAGEYRITANDVDFDFFGGGSQDDKRTALVEVDGVEHVTGITLLWVPEEVTPDPTGDGVVSGRVFDDRGDPIAGAGVEVTCMSNPLPVTRYGETDEEGNFSITGLPNNISRVDADADGHTPAKLSISGGATEGLELVLLRNATISGRIVPPADELVSSFRVTFRPYSDGSDESGDLQATIENMVNMFEGSGDWTAGQSDGTFTIEDVSVGTVELVAKATGFAESLSAPITLQAGQEVTGVEIFLIRGGSITGRVVNDSGQPMEGAIVSLRTVSGDATEEMFEKFMPAMMREGKTVATGGRGRFSFSRLSYAEYEVVAKHGDLAPSPGERVEVLEDREYPLRDLIVSAGGVIAGTIVDQNGEPKSGLMIQLLSPEIGMQMANADAEGKFEFASLKPGEYSVMIVDMTAMQRGDTKIKTRHVEITGGETKEVEIAYGKGYKLSGQIKGFDTMPFQQSIQVSRPGGPSSADVNPMDVADQMKLIKYLAGMALVKPDGTFVVEDLEPGTYIVEVPVVPDNPLDAKAYETDRTPLYRKEITVKERDMELDIRVNPR